MKKSVIISALVLVGIVSVNAQSRFNSSYSVANYKQPNKAKIAADLNLDNSIAQAYSNSGEQAAFDNYKNSFASAGDNGGVLPILPADANFGLASSGNYKMQFKSAKSAPVEVPVKSEPVVMNF